MTPNCRDEIHIKALKKLPTVWWATSDNARWWITWPITLLEQYLIYLQKY